MKSIASPCRFAVLALALLAPTPWLAPLRAEEPAAAQAAVDPYVDLYAAMDAVLGSEQEFNRQYRFMMGELRQLPIFEGMERSNPGIVNAIGAAMRPWLKQHSDRMEVRSRPLFLDLMKTELSPEDARKLAAYCRTERGRKFLLNQFSPEQLYFAQPSQPLGQPTAFLKPAESYVPPAAKPADPPKPAADQPADPAVAAILEDPELQARLTGFFAAIEALSLELGSIEPDQDIKDGIFRDIDYVASSYGWRLFERPLR